MEAYAGFPEQFIAIWRMQNAGLLRRERPLVLASGQKSLKFMDVAESMRRLSGSCDGAPRQDVFITDDTDGHSGGDRDQEARATYESKEARGGSENDGWRPQCRWG